MIGSSRSLARALTGFASAGLCRAYSAAPGAIGSRRALILRIVRLMDDARPRKLRCSGTILGTCVVGLIIVALVLQAVSPALAFANRPASPDTPMATTGVQGCIDSHRGPGPFHRHTYGPGGPEVVSPSLPVDVLDKIVARYPADTVTYTVAVDAKGHPHDLRILHQSGSSDLNQKVKRAVLADTFQPAQVQCRAVAGSFSSAVTHFAAPKLFVNAQRLPVPGGTGSVGTCATSRRNPSITDLVKITPSSSLLSLSENRSLIGTVLVRVDRSGNVSNVSMYGRPVMAQPPSSEFDDALQKAAKRTSYSPGCRAVRSTYMYRAAPTRWLEP